MKPRRSTPAFAYRAGIRIPGTEITCDALGFPSDLVFLSHANAFPPHGRTGRRQFVTTATTLRLLGAAGEKLRDRVLPATFGRPFNLGPHRLEIVPTGFLPGAAALLCQTDSARAFYLGSFCLEPLFEGIEPALMRQADALCVDATYGDPNLRYAPRPQTLAELRAFVEASLHRRGRVALLGSPFGGLPAVAVELGRAGLPLRAHRRIVDVAARLRLAGTDLPALPRFAGQLHEGEVLLWPSDGRQAAGLTALGDLELALVSGAAADPAVLDAMKLRHGFALDNRPSFSEIEAAIDATGAREVALFHGAAEPAAQRLRQHGIEAYALGPPRQMPLPSKS